MIAKGNGVKAVLAQGHYVDGELVDSSLQQGHTKEAMNTLLSKMINLFIRYIKYLCAANTSDNTTVCAAMLSKQAALTFIASTEVYSINEKRLSILTTIFIKCRLECLYPFESSLLCSFLSARLIHAEWLDFGGRSGIRAYEHSSRSWNAE